MTAMQTHENETLINLLKDSIYANTLPATLPEPLNSSPELRLFYADIVELREFILAIAQGDFSRSPRVKGYLAGALKTLQAGLRHLTWQTQMIAQGDFSHRIDFMGEFSEAFNAMVVRLDASVQELNRANQELLHEIEERKRIEAALRESEENYKLLSITDALTGLFNRRYFYELALTEFDRSSRHLRQVAIIIYDLDDFKNVNDSFGHIAGDMALKHIAALSGKEVRKIDVLARYGGEEFICLLPETGLKKAALVAERIRSAIESHPLEYQGSAISVTASFGVAAIEHNMDASESYMSHIQRIIKQADGALYQAKAAGKNRVVAAPVV
jgi:diguanylate cyclase (GGDEF)-like protein